MEGIRRKEHDAAPHHQFRILEMQKKSILNSLKKKLKIKVIKGQSVRITHSCRITTKLMTQIKDLDNIQTTLRRAVPLSAKCFCKKA
jgi:hypothetical protein